MLQPFHEGEIQVQEALQDRDVAILNGRLFEDAVIPAAHRFLGQQVFLVLSASNTHDHIPVTIVYGVPGFISIEESGKRISISITSHVNQNQDPVLRILHLGTRVGALAIDLATRRRLRINGHVESVTADVIVMIVDESYPNCPKYIQKRVIDDARPCAPADYRIAQGTSLLAAHLQLITTADTFFVSSLNPNGHADTSHRGGPRGFIRILDNGDLRIPDYQGNRLYNTFGNFQLNPYAGIVIWDFDNSGFLHLHGEVKFDFAGLDEVNETGGTGRWWVFTPQSWVWQRVAIPFQIRFEEFSPYLPMGKIQTHQTSAGGEPLT